MGAVTVPDLCDLKLSLACYGWACYLQTQVRTSIHTTLIIEIYQMALYLSGTTRGVNKKILCALSIFEMTTNGITHLKKPHDELQYLNLVDHILQNGKSTDKINK